MGNEYNVINPNDVEHDGRPYLGELRGAVLDVFPDWPANKQISYLFDTVWDLAVECRDLQLKLAKHTHTPRMTLSQRPGWGPSVTVPTDAGIGGETDE